MDKTSLQNASPVISLNQLSKVYHVPERDPGVKAALISVFRRKYKDVASVDKLSFDVEAGEIVGFLGPNGAGKTTTIKMLAGLLYPSSGDVRVLDQIPWKRKNDLLRQITLIMGQRNQLQWDLPAMDSYEFLRAIYGIPYDAYKKTLNELIDMLDIGDVLNKPVRNLSLGERMKCEIAGALLHRPRIVFLDEPSIGLDVTVQHRLRSFIADYNREHGATVLLTSHYVPDVEVLCKRVIFINQGKLVYDGQLNQIADRILPNRTVVLQLSGDESYNLEGYGKVLEQADGRVKLEVPKAHTASATSRLLADLPVKDLSVIDPPIEEVIRYMFSVNESEEAVHPVEEAV